MQLTNIVFHRWLGCQQAHTFAKMCSFPSIPAYPGLQVQLYAKGHSARVSRLECRGRLFLAAANPQARTSYLQMLKVHVLGVLITVLCGCKSTCVLYGLAPPLRILFRDEVCLCGRKQCACCKLCRRVCSCHVAAALLIRLFCQFASDLIVCIRKHSLAGVSCI